MQKSLLVLTLGLSLMISGCQTVYNATMENVFKMEKRELLTKLVGSVKKDQEKTQEELADALTQLKNLYQFDGGDLERAYDKFKGSYENSYAQAQTLRRRINHMDDVARSMFNEWENEIKQFTNQSFAADSRQKLKETQRKYQNLNQSVRRSEESLKPVLSQLNDQVLYLKHNLNSSALGVIQTEADRIQIDIQNLISQMNQSISEANDFINTLE